MDMDVEICTKVCADRSHFTYFCSVIFFSFFDIENERLFLSKQKDIIKTGIYQVIKFLL